MKFLFVLSLFTLPFVTSLICCSTLYANSIRMSVIRISTSYPSQAVPRSSRTQVKSYPSKFVLKLFQSQVVLKLYPSQVVLKSSHTQVKSYFCIIVNVNKSTNLKIKDDLLNILNIRDDVTCVGDSQFKLGVSCPSRCKFVSTS